MVELYPAVKFLAKNLLRGKAYFKFITKNARIIEHDKNFKKCRRYETNSERIFY
jgi:hypothetical protein